MTLSGEDLIGCIDAPNETVAKILNRRNISIQDDVDVPTQLTLFDFNDYSEGNE